nr:hypothetical protein CFP56_53388 [Quercus suber]
MYAVIPCVRTVNQLTNTGLRHEEHGRGVYRLREVSEKTRLSESSMFGFLMNSMYSSMTNIDQKKFTDAVNGKSGLTYLSAKESEVCGHMT